MIDIRSQPKVAASLLLDPREAATFMASPRDASFTLVERAGRGPSREVHAGCHKPPVRRHNHSPRCCAWHEKGRVVPREPYPIDDIVKKVSRDWAHQLPPRCKFPEGNRHRGYTFLFTEDSSNLPHKTAGSAALGVLPCLVLTKRIDARSPATLVQGKEPCTLVVVVRCKEVHNMRTPSRIQHVNIVSG